MLTLFEMTTQHGYIVAVLNEFVRALGKDLRNYRIEFVSARPSNVRYMRLWYLPRVQDEPSMVYQIPERHQMQSKAMWQEDVRAELIKLWKDVFGKRTGEESNSTDSSPSQSSTDAPPPWETSSSKSEAEASESTESAPSPPTKASDSKTSPSSPRSKRPYKRRAKSSPSSSGESTASST